MIFYIAAVEGTKTAAIFEKMYTKEGGWPYDIK